MVVPDVDASYYTSEPHPEWYHLDCFKENLTELDAVDVVADHIPGFKSLKRPDQKLLIEALGESGMTATAGCVLLLGGIQEKCLPYVVKVSLPLLQEEEGRRWL